MIYAGVDDCQPSGIYINDSAEEPRFTRVHLSDAQALILAWQLNRLVFLRRRQVTPEEGRVSALSSVQLQPDD